MAIQVLSAPVSSFVAPQTQSQSMQKGAPRTQQPAFNLHGDTFESSAQKAPQNANVRSQLADQSFFSSLRDQLEGFAGKIGNAVSDSFEKTRSAVEAVENAVGDAVGKARSAAEGAVDHFLSPSNDTATSDRNPTVKASPMGSSNDEATSDHNPTVKSSPMSSPSEGASASSGSEGSGDSSGK